MVALMAPVTALTRWVSVSTRPKTSWLYCVEPLGWVVEVSRPLPLEKPVPTWSYDQPKLRLGWPAWL